MKMFGWTMKQWGLAIALSNKNPKSMRDFLKIKKDYQKNHRMDPIETLTIYNPKGDERPCDYETAAKLYALLP